jgi:hypothetical protein
MSVDAKIFTLCDHTTGGKTYMVDLCPKCLGKGYYYDIEFDLQGQAKLITGTHKLQQEVLKICNDEKGNNLYFSRWGSNLHNLIGSKQDKLSNSRLQMMVRMSLEYLQLLQQSANKEYGNFSQDEILLGIESIEMQSYVVGYDMNVTLKNQSNDILNQTILL